MERSSSRSTARRALVLMGLLAGLLLYTSPSPAHDCPGPGGSADPACMCSTLVGAPQSAASPPSCYLGTIWTTISTHHGCCSESGCYDDSDCEWQIGILAQAKPGYSCHFKILRDGSLLSECASCSSLRYISAGYESAGCSDFKAYTVTADGSNGNWVYRRNVVCATCAG
jgi:hypothetical protein